MDVVLFSYVVNIFNKFYLLLLYFIYLYYLN